MKKSDFLGSWLHKPAHLADAAVAGGGDAEAALEGAGEMEGAIEAAETGGFFDRGVRSGQQAGGALEPRLDEPCLRRHAGVRLEQAAEIIRVEPAGTRPLHDGDLVAEAFLDPALRGEHVMDGFRFPEAGS